MYGGVVSRQGPLYGHHPLKWDINGIMIWGKSGSWRGGGSMKGKNWFTAGYPVNVPSDLLHMPAVSVLCEIKTCGV